MKLPAWRNIWWRRRPPPEMGDGEKVITEGKAILLAGLIGARVGPLLLTNQRLIWYEEAVARPLWLIADEVRLRSVKCVDKGTLLDVVGGGRPLRMKLEDGSMKCVRLASGSLDTWVDAVREAVSLAKTDTNA
jgi:hypothetical protein